MKANKIARLILLAILLFLHCEICAQEHQIKTYIHHRIVWPGNPEIQQWNADDTVFIVDTCFSISTVCQIYGDTLKFYYPFDNSNRIVFILKHGGKYYHTNATTISKSIIDEPGAILVFEWTDIQDMDEDDKSEWDNYFAIYFDNINPYGDPVLFGQVFVVDQESFFMEGEALAKKARAVAADVR